MGGAPTTTSENGETVDGRRARLAPRPVLRQAAALAILLGSERTLALYVACILFGTAVGNTNTLPPLIVQQEFPQAHFSRVVSLVVAINHFAFALGPLLLGTLRDWTGNYQLPFLVCVALEITAALVVLFGRRAHPTVVAGGRAGDGSGAG